MYIHICIYIYIYIQDVHGCAFSDLMLALELTSEILIFRAGSGAVDWASDGLSLSFSPASSKLTPSQRLPEEEREKRLEELEEKERVRLEQQEEPLGTRFHCRFYVSRFLNSFLMNI
jgi:hypothetical protein